MSAHFGSSLLQLIGLVFAVIFRFSDFVLSRFSLSFFLMLLLAWTALLSSAFAHPHVKVMVRTELLMDEQSRLVAVKHQWTFDEGYTAFATQGLDTNKDGIFSVEELAPLAKINAEALQEHGFFTFLKMDAAQPALGAARDYRLDYDKGRVTLTFTLPLREPVSVQGKTLRAEVYDPTFYVAFLLEENDAAKQLGSRCLVEAKRAKGLEEAERTLTEAFFERMGEMENFGRRFANTVLVHCP